MTLASQSYRSQQRRRNMSASRSIVPIRGIFFLGLAAIVVGGAWWLLRPAPEPAPDDTTPLVATGDDEPERPAPAPAREQPPTTLREIVARNESPAPPPDEVPAITMVPRGTTPTQSPPPTPPERAPEQAPPTTPPPAVARETPPSAPPTANADLARAYRLQASDPVAARLLATRAIDSASLPRAERERAYELLNAVSRQLFFNPNVNPNDPLMEVYTVRSGDTLEKIVRERKLGCDYRLLLRLNGISDPRKLRVGQRLRLPKGDFHAEVLKNEYRLNLYLGEGSERVLVSSLRVGLGESNGTPTGLFRVRPSSKLVDPEWTHPRTGEHFRSNDPKNPIGEHWIGLVGVEDRTREFLGYGIHGTIEPDSIGQDRSLGCVRMLADDVALVYECLTEPNSTVLIR